MPVLLEAFPQGLDAHDPERAGELRVAYEEGVDNQGGLLCRPPQTSQAALEGGGRGMNERKFCC
jgi:hypothetical protein